VTLRKLLYESTIFYFKIGQPCFHPLKFYYLLHFWLADIGLFWVSNSWTVGIYKTTVENVVPLANSRSFPGTSVVDCTMFFYLSLYSLRRGSLHISPYRYIYVFLNVLCMAVLMYKNNFPNKLYLLRLPWPFLQWFSFIVKCTFHSSVFFICLRDTYHSIEVISIMPLFHGPIVPLSWNLSIQDIFPFCYISSLLWTHWLLSIFFNHSHSGPGFKTMLGSLSGSGKWNEFGIRLKWYVDIVKYIYEKAHQNTIF
jgi:hypothetical protein